MLGQGSGTVLPEERRARLVDLYNAERRLAGKKVLIVDDDMRNIFAMTSFLERYEVRISSAENGRDAITMLGGNRFNGVNFVKVLARYKPGERVPVNYLRNGRPMTATIVVGPPLVFDYRIEEDPKATAEMKALRTGWLNGK